MWVWASLLGDEGIDLAKVLDDVTDELLHARVVGHVELVHLDLDAVLVAELLRVLLGALLARGVGDGDAGAHLGASAGGLDAHAARARGARDGDDLALEAEEVVEAVGLGDLLDHFGGWWCLVGVGVWESREAVAGVSWSSRDVKVRVVMCW